MSELLILLLVYTPPLVLGYAIGRWHGRRVERQGCHEETERVREYYQGLCRVLLTEDRMRPGEEW